MGDVFKVTYDDFEKQKLKQIGSKIYRETSRGMDPSKFEAYVSELSDSQKIELIDLNGKEIELIDGAKELNKRPDQVFIKVPYSGSSEALKIKPNPYTNHHRIISADITPSYIQIQFRLDRFDSDYLESTWDRDWEILKKNITRVNRMIETFNNKLNTKIMEILKERHSHYKETTDFMDKLDLSKE